jgi:hypothetical protein
MSVIVTAVLPDVTDLGNLDRSDVTVEIGGIAFRSIITSFIESDEPL